MSALLLLKWSGVLALLGALALALKVWVLDPQSRLHARLREQSAALDGRLRRLFLPARGRLIVSLQLSAAGLVVLGALWFGKPSWLGALVPVALAPRLLLLRLQKQRTVAIESRIDAFTLAFANALRATPNIARALESVAITMQPPLREELDLTLRELRVGSTLDQALRDLGLRVASPRFDATMSALLIGRRVGGNVPEILNDTASTLREIVRLQATLRAKTADGRIQAIVLAAFPVLLVIGFDLMMPGYFKPLTESVAGGLILVGAGASWISALALSRKILLVQV
jgi:tight adherence protein B